MKVQTSQAQQSHMYHIQHSAAASSKVKKTAMTS
jgi:hypothetical protein